MKNDLDIIVKKEMITPARDAIATLGRTSPSTTSNQSEDSRSLESWWKTVSAFVSYAIGGFTTTPKKPTKQDYSTLGNTIKFNKYKHEQ